MRQLLHILSFLICVALCISYPIHLSHVPEPYKTIVVAGDGSGDFKTVQAAVDSLPNGNTEWIEILIKPGTYYSHVTIPSSKTFIKLIGGGATPADTILSFDITTSTPNVSYLGSGAFVAENDDFYAQGITFENTHGEGTQAIAVSLAGNRQQFKTCIFKGFQDTLYAAQGLQYFENSTIYGAVDFIYGGATALFESCIIHNVGGGAVTAARTPEGTTYGLTFLNCTLSADSNVSSASVYLGRTWGPYATVDFLYSNEGAHISPLGWNNMGNPSYQPTVKLAEYKNYGLGSNISKRVNWSSQLTDTEAIHYTKQQILGNWAPL